MIKLPLVCVTGLLFGLPLLVQAENFVPLIGLPGIENGPLTTETYIDALYRFSIAVAAFLAVVKLIFAGVQYALSGIVTTKESAKNDIKGAVLGLLIVLGAVLILQEINPRLTDFTLFQNVPTAIGRQVVVVNQTIFEERGLTPDESNAINLEGLSNTERTRALQEIDCPEGSRPLIANNEIRCDADPSINQGDRFNTAERFTRLGASGTEGVYNEFTSPFEPEGVSEAEVQSVISTAGGNDYLFVVRVLDSDSSVANADIVRQQQRILCEDQNNGALENSADQRFSVCVVVNE